MPAQPLHVDVEAAMASILEEDYLATPSHSDGEQMGGLMSVFCHEIWDSIVRQLHTCFCIEHAHSSLPLGLCWTW